MSKYLIKQVKLFGEEVVDIEISGGKISQISKEISETDFDSSKIIKSNNGKSKVALPGFVDLHTHLREPGREDSETVETASRAAIKGGFTAITAMANTNPVADNAGVVEQVLHLGKQCGLVDVFPIGAVTVGLQGEKLAELHAMNQSAAKVQMFSDDGKCVHDPLLMRRALEYVKSFDGVIAQHAQDPRLTESAQMNEGKTSAKLGLAGWPAVAEEAIIARDILLAEHVDSRLHICHLSTAGGIELIKKAKERGLKVTAEVTPHHLLLTEDLAESYNPIYKVNPPLRTKTDVIALRNEVASGVIDIIATDHAPHPQEDKDCEWAAAAFGMLGLETAFSIAFQALVQTKLMNLKQLSEVMSKNPAKIGRYKNQGLDIKVGNSANIVLIDLENIWKVDPENLQSKSKNTPYAGMELPGVITEVFTHGILKLQAGKLLVG